MNKPVILSTRTLDQEQKSRFENSGIILIENDFINISSQSFDISDTLIKPSLLLFTSQNAVKSIIENKDCNFLKTIPTICVGIKTKEFLEKNNFRVLESENYAKNLAPIIAEKHRQESILFFSGNIRSNILPETMKLNAINFEEIVVYKNTATPSKILEKLDAILFLSPSAVDSYINQNKINNEVCFCIGSTTAQALMNITKNIIIAEEQTIENLIDSCINYFKS